MHIEAHVRGLDKGQNSGSVKRVKSDCGSGMIFKFFGTVLTNRIYRVVYRLSQLSFCVQLVDHLQYFVKRIGRRLTKPLLPHSPRSQAKIKYNLICLGSTRLIASADVRL